MENPSFSHPVYNFLGVSGTILLFAVMVMYARMPGNKEADIQQKVSVVADVSVGVPVETPEPVIAVAVEMAAAEAPVTVDPQLVVQGKTLYDMYCAACHGLAGKKRSPLLVGSDIFDDESAYGTDDATVRRLIEDGIIEVGMVPWKSVLTAGQIDSLVAYIASEHYTGASAS